MRRTSSRRRGTSVRTKLLLLSAAPVLVTGALLLSLFLWAHESTSAKYERALAWDRHAQALRGLDSAARFYLDTVADDIVEEPMPHDAESRAELRRARVEALTLAAGFSEEEQAAQAHLDVQLGELVARGERVGLDRTRLWALADHYRQVIDPQIHELIEREEKGSAIAIREAHDASDAVRIGGLVVAVLALLTALGASFAAIRGFGRRVAALEAAAARVAAGDLEGTVPVTSSDEIGRLARSLNTMVEALRRQRTRQLGFLAAVAHDLRNPLAAMRLCTEGLLGGSELPPAPKLRKSIALVDRQIQRLGQLADDLLDAASIEAGELKLSPRSCDLGAVARDVIALYAGTSARHELRLSAPAEPVLAVCDPTRITQVLDNLVNNAIKYSPAGGLVEIALTADADEVVVSVADSGVGIEARFSEAIFEPFRRLSPTKDVLPGVGLGLSICRRIVVAHGGRIDVESQPGRGTRFDVHLPRGAPARDALPSALPHPDRRPILT